MQAGPVHIIPPVWKSKITETRTSPNQLLIKSIYTTVHFKAMLGTILSSYTRKIVISFPFLHCLKKQGLKLSEFLGRSKMKLASSSPSVAPLLTVNPISSTICSWLTFRFSIISPYIEARASETSRIEAKMEELLLVAITLFWLM